MTAKPRTLLDHVSGRLEIEISTPPEPVTERLSNLKAPREAQIAGIRLEPYIFENHERRPLTQAELDDVALSEPHVRLRSAQSDEVIHFDAPNGIHFTVRDLLTAVEETERKTRGSTEWFDGIDIHHIFFEGLHLDAEGVWRISWGS
jgi:hypothetical protein